MEIHGVVMNQKSATESAQRIARQAERGVRGRGRGLGQVASIARTLTGHRRLQTRPLPKARRKSEGTYAS